MMLVGGTRQQLLLKREQGACIVYILPSQAFQGLCLLSMQGFQGRVLHRQS